MSILLFCVQCSVYLFIHLLFTPLLSALSAILIGAGTDMPSDSFEVKPCNANYANTVCDSILYKHFTIPELHLVLKFNALKHEQECITGCW